MLEPINASVTSDGHARTRLIIALVFALAISAIDWPGLWLATNQFPMVDRTVYLHQIQTSNLRTDYFRYADFSRYITDEFLWNWYLAHTTRTLQIDPEIVFLSISVFCMGTFAAIAYSRGSLFSLIMLVNPLVIDFAFSQLRLALAMSLLGCAYLARRMPVVAIALVIPTLFIHTAAALFVGIFAIGLLLTRIPPRSTWGLIVPGTLVLIGLAVGVLAGPLRQNLLLFFSDRRAAVDASTVVSSALYLSFWALLFVLFAIDWRRYLNNVVTNVAFCILAIAAVSILTGAYATRFVAATFPFILLAGGQLFGPSRMIFLFGLPAYAIIQWLYWVRLA